MRWSLRNQIFVPFGALMLVVLILVSAINAYLAAGHSTDQIVRQIQRIARTMQTSTYPLNDSILAQTRALSGTEFIVTDEMGRVSASSVEVPTVFLPPSSATQAGAGLPSTVEVAGQSYFHSVVRTERGQQRTPQRLHILYPERIWRETRWRAAYPPLLVGGLALAVVFALSITISSRLSRPLLQLQQQVGQLAQGHFEPLALPRRDDEIRGLIAAVNALVADLVAYSQAIKRSERLALMGQLSGGFAHHLRNAVTGATLALQLHQRSCRDVDQESLTVAQRQLRLTEEQLQRFLTAGQPQSPNRVVCHLPQVLGEVARLVGPICQHRKVTLHCAPPPEPLPDVSADSALLHQALLNLVLNAIEAAGTNGWVRIEYGPSANAHLAIRVLDSGPGPPAEIRPRLFEPFATGKPEGIGLGLAAAKQIAEAHGGRLTFTGDQPTCFELWLPMLESLEI
ncbi:MAG: HAMP domain-containing sensor histidine kinase [Planctomycetota bacterium]|nr:HAMP domain-containing sensor histidine kinase [Planctomycetota bacterium]